VDPQGTFLQGGGTLAVPAPTAYASESVLQAALAGVRLLTGR
jgi:hypothetical protein